MIGLLITAAIALLLISAALSPMETLGWWAGWIDSSKPPQADIPPLAAESPAADQKADNVVVYLSGVGIVTGDQFFGDEQPFVDYLKANLPRSAVVDNVFPYSVLNRGLTGQRPAQRFWKWIASKRSWEKASFYDLPVILRNVFQVAVAADSRYGPIYNLGMAREIVAAMERLGYGPGSGLPVWIVGYSGGAQVGLGAAPYLAGMLRAPIRLVSLGGVMSGDIGIRYVESVDHFYGTKDPIWKLGPIAYPSRWTFISWSVWNRTAPGKYRQQEIGPFAHFGPGSYFDPKFKLPNGEPYLKGSADAIIGAIKSAESRPASAQA